MIIKHGSYTGNGTTQDLTALGAAATFVLVKTSAQIAALWTSTMPAASFKPATGSSALTTTNGITQHASGFTVGSAANVNTNATTYDYVAISDNADGNVSVGSYVGNGSDNRNITLSGFSGTPDLVLVLGDTAQPTAWRTSAMSGDSSQTFGTSLTTNIIQAFGSGNFQVGTSAIVNTATATPTYYYLALKNVANLFKVLDDGSNRAYLGDTTDNRTITGAGFQPDSILVKSVSTDEPCWYAARFTTDTCHHLTASADASDRIQARASDGFQVGTNVRVNSAQNYHALAFKDGTAAAAPVSPSGSLLLLGVG